jgi:hypothetical protein
MEQGSSVRPLMTVWWQRRQVRMRALRVTPSTMTPVSWRWRRSQAGMGAVVLVITVRQP